MILEFLILSLSGSGFWNFCSTKKILSVQAVPDERGMHVGRVVCRCNSVSQDKCTIQNVSTCNHTIITDWEKCGIWFSQDRNVPHWFESKSIP